MKNLRISYSLRILIIFFCLYFSSTNAQIIKTFAGNGTYVYSGDGGSADSAGLAYPTGVAMDASGNLFIADHLNNRIRKVSNNGVITTVAGNGFCDGSGNGGYSGDGGSATSAELSNPYGVAVDASGNLFIADLTNNRIRKVSTSGVITTVAGNGFGAGNGKGGYGGDGGSATSAKLHGPTGVAVDASGNLFIADATNNRIRKINTNGIITTVAGNGTKGFSGDGGSAISAELYDPEGVAVDASGNLFIADYLNNRIRKVNTSGIITTVAGNGTKGYSGDGGSADSAELRGPTGVAVDSIGNLFIADYLNNRIRKVSNNGVITTVAGNGFGAGNGQGRYSGDGGSADSAELNNPYGVAVDASGNLFIADYNNSRIREVIGGTVPVTITNYELRITNEKQVVNSWEATNEINVSHYNIQRSTNSKDFETVGTVKAIGNGANNYSFTDNKPVNGINYYRLQSVDKDGSSSYSKVVSCELSVVSNQLTVYPNPAKEAVTINGSHIASVQVIDNMGRVVKVVELKDATNPTLSISSLAAGVYHLRIQTMDGDVSGVGFVKE